MIEDATAYAIGYVPYLLVLLMLGIPTIGAVFVAFPPRHRPPVVKEKREQPVQKLVLPPVEDPQRWFN